jgi:hypothetical protein
MASRRPQATLSSLLTGCLARCRSLIGSDGPIGTPIITCVSSGCEWSPLLCMIGSLVAGKHMFAAVGIASTSSRD